MKNIKIMLRLLPILLLILGACSNNNKDISTELILATTTSTQDSGLLDVLVPVFEETHNVYVKTIAVGTGQALALGERGEADVLLTHASSSEEKLVENKDVINRKRVMYNDFIVVGPSDDPASIRGLGVQEALVKIFASGSTFVSRGDNSGTHMMELNLWEEVRIKPTNESWYVETGQGMGSTLQVSAERDGYVLTDRATFLSHLKNFEHMDILVEGDNVLLNIYHVMQVNEQKHPIVNDNDAKLFVKFLISDEVQQIIEEFGIELYDQPLFFPYTE
ncbi:tungsten ABC transporter substrate-binding protein [Anaerobacillus alkalilacustris]|uniref:Tungsten ABC transporter substrate-binding protein n=1 Tax=Anaerobacillus alkalilacustris TaxID=393763 RepID=A0A1S2LHL3_9BACI|nr:substrate-binding domain-containing protein [Anaerobacillus alkalilacustris]OIJ12018.1 tungsten ABC transporter substrate-binding protein [Anaerobacillus alkalilacustris]